MRKYFDSIIGSDGRPVAGASVTVTPFGGGSPSSLFSDSAGASPKVNPISTDTNGYFEFYAADGRYTLTVSASGFGTRTLTDIALEDPADPSQATINGGSINNTPIGATTPNSGAFTNLSAERLDFDTTPPAQANQPGRLHWNNADSIQTLSLDMAGGHVVQQVGEETYYRVKAQGNILDGDVVMLAGTLGNSGGLLAAKATGLTSLQSEYILGVATEDIANNTWGYVTFFGEVKGIDTTGGGEAWVDGQILYYNPAVAGGLTKNKPSVPNAIVVVATVVHAHANGILFVRPTYGYHFGQIDTNVSFGTLADGNLVSYDLAQQRWINIAQSALGAVGTTSLTSSGAIRTTSASNPIGYNAGAGGTVTQLVSKATAVTLDRPSGQIIMHNDLLAAGAKVVFVLNNSNVAITDVAVLSFDASVGSVNTNYTLAHAMGIGQIFITLKNDSVGDLSEAVKINFALIKTSVI